MDIETCYCCEMEATSKEHAPPKCIFPEAKDTNGKNFRKGLITVPSCDVHNTAKSKDDEYLLGVLAFNILNNSEGSNQATSKVLRAVTRSKGLAQALLNHITPVLVKNAKTNKMDETVAVRINENRIKSAFKQMALAIFYHHYEKKYEGVIDCYYEGLVNLDGIDPVKTNQKWENLRKTSDQLFKNKSYYGENPDIFVYQIFESPENGKPKAMRLKFYGKNNCTVLFK